jgi:exopolyphosphatase/guanosine-5'-triphosphate,3'-diphosphate pyrophosphatase
MILAGIDIGTNTLRLLIAETGQDKFLEIDSERRITRLGEDLHRTRRLSPEAQKRTVETLLDFSINLKKHNVAAVSAVGTSALRNAENAESFISDVAAKTGLSIRVISGEEEARLTLLGVARALRGVAFEGTGGPLTPVLVVDIGGGSTEFISVGPGAEPQEASIPLGAVYLTERFIKHDPPLERELDQLRLTIRKEVDGCGIRPYPGNAVLAGTAGTVTTLAAIEQRLAEYDSEKINGFKMTRASIDRIVSNLSRSALQERRKIPGLESGREDIILAGSVIIQEVMERFGYPEMLVSDWGLREGIVFDLYRRVRGEDREARLRGRGCP